MTQTQLNRAVANATGESIGTIKSIGFSLLDNPANHDSADDQILVADCPFCGATVLLSAEGPEELSEFAECLKCNVLYDYHDREIYAADLCNERAEPSRSAA